MENLDEALALMITKALESVDTSIGFLQAELPEVITQLLMWHGVKSVIFCFAGITLGVIAPCVFYRLLKWVNTPYNEPRKHSEYSSVMMHSRLQGKWSSSGSSYMEINYSMPLALTGGLLLILFFIGFSMFNLTWLQIWIAPKVWLLEYAAAMVK